MLKGRAPGQHSSAGGGSPRSRKTKFWLIRFTLFNRSEAQFELQPDAAERRTRIVGEDDTVHLARLDELARPPERLMLGREGLSAFPILIAPFLQREQRCVVVRDAIVHLVSSTRVTQLRRDTADPDNSAVKARTPRLKSSGLKKSPRLPQRAARI